MDFQFLEFLRAYGGAIALLASVIVLLLASKFVTKEALAAAFIAPTKETAGIEARLKVAESKLDAVEDRVTLLQKDVEHLPDRDATHRLELAVMRLEGKMEAFDERMKPVAEMARRTQEHLLNDK